MITEIFIASENLGYMYIFFRGDSIYPLQDAREQEGTAATHNNKSIINNQDGTKSINKGDNVG